MQTIENKRAKTSAPRKIFRFLSALRPAVLALTVLTLMRAGVATAAAPTMKTAFWAQDWRTMDAIAEKIAASSADLWPKSLSTQDTSLYLNGLWRQGRYAEGLAIIEELRAKGRAFPSELQPYADMLTVLALERTNRKQEARDLGVALWERAPLPLRYYLAYALGRASRDLSQPAEAIAWFRRMLELAPDQKRRLQALGQMSSLPGMTPDEMAALLIDAPSNAKALAACRALPSGSSSRVEYALGYNAYINRKYEPAMEHLSLASRDVEYGEAARYYLAYAAYRKDRLETAFQLWSDIALKDSEFPQRSVARLTTLAGKAKKSQVIDIFKKVADVRTDYPDLAADALVGIIRLGDGAEVTAAEKKLFTDYKSTNQAATARWEHGWKAWKAGSYKEAHQQWTDGYAPEIPNRELASRILYWQSRALEKLNSPEAAARVKKQLVQNYPAEYHTFLVDPDGGITDAKIPASYDIASTLEDWGFVTYARLEAADAANSGADADVSTLFRAVRLSAWEGDYGSSVRAFGALQRRIPVAEGASAELLRCYFPRAFEPEVRAAAQKTGLDPAYIWGIMRQESLYESDVTSTAGAYGLMQLMPATARGEAQKMKMQPDAYLTPANNVMLGANHFTGLMAAFKQQVPPALAAYNAGGTPVRRWSEGGIPDMTVWVEDIAYRETRGYVKAVLRNIEVYRNLSPDKKEGAK
jgi:soluble lytic murein transglycosylase